MTLQQDLEIVDINNGNGFTLIQVNETPIIKGYKHVIHVINLTDYESNINIIEQNSKLFPNIPSDINQKIKDLRSHFNTLIPHYKNKRGIFNFIGKGFKWLFGTMDANDENEIEKYFKAIEENNHNLIINVNNQVEINNRFNDQIKNLTNKLNTDIKWIFDKINTFVNSINQLEIQFAELTFEIKIKENIDFIMNDIHKIKEIMLSARLGILSRDIFTLEEMEKNDINLNSLQHIELKIALYKDSILLVIDIPQMTTELYKNIIIQPIPNKENQLELKTDITEFIANKERVYYPTNNKKKLKLIDDLCIANILKTKMENCTFVYNNKSSISKNTNDFITLINIKKQTIIHNCNQIELQIKGNYLIHLKNCKININNLTFGIDTYNHEVILPNTLKTIKYKEVTKLTFEEISHETIRNNKKIIEIKYQNKVHQHVLYSINFIIVIVIIIITISYLYLKKKKLSTISNQIIVPTGAQSCGGGVLSTTLDAPGLSIF